MTTPRRPVCRSAHRPRSPHRRVSLAITAALAVSTLVGPVAPPAHALDNGLALTPPLGWNTWNAFHCDINESKIRAMADEMVRLGLKDAGYTYLVIDDCWAATTRDARGNLRGDPQRFPSGMKALADYIHSKGLKAGIYAAPGSCTCTNVHGKYPGKLGSLGHEQQDATSFAAWGYDFLKYDWCRADQDGLLPHSAFATMGQALARTGRPIVYSIHKVPEIPVLSWQPQVANMWRTTKDIDDNWSSMISVGLSNLYGQRYQRPGAWNDADMLQVGNGGMTVDEYRTHMTLWSIMGTPLMIGTDLRKLTPEMLGILTNRTMLAVNQDRLGAAAQAISFTPAGIVVARRLSGGRIAVALINPFNAPRTVTLPLHMLTNHGMEDADRYLVRDVWSGSSHVAMESVTRTVGRHSAAFYVLTPMRHHMEVTFSDESLQLP